MAVVNYIWDPVTDAYLGEQDETGTTIATYTQEPVQYGSLISQRRGGQTSYYHYDGPGDTRELTNASEVVTDTNMYDAWGVNVASTGTTENPFRWRGKVGYFHDGAAEYYVRARNYQPTIGRWMSADPVAFVEGTNLYAAYFVPRGVDPSGTFPPPAPPPLAVLCARERDACDAGAEDQFIGCVTLGAIACVLLCRDIGNRLHKITAFDLCMAPVVVGCDKEQDRRRVCCRRAEADCLRTGTWPGGFWYMTKCLWTV